MPALKSPQAVDTHAHVFSASAPAVAGARYRPPYAATLDGWRAQWVRAGITHGVLVQPSFFGTDNGEMLAALADDPRHLRGVAVVDSSCDAGEIARLDRGGVRAIRLNLKGAGDYSSFASASWRDLYRRVNDSGWHVEVFVDAGRLPDIAAAFEGIAVPLVFDHFGNPGRDAQPIFAAVERLSASREVWCKLSAPYRLEDDDARVLASRWLDAVGPRRLVWGSDWPGTGFEASHDYAGLRNALDGWIDGSLTAAVLWDNAARLYRFD
jgi:predicted TIM-barrel fold metal-dependent hydrolase